MDDAQAREAFGGGLNPEIEEMMSALTPETLWCVKAWRLYRDGHLWFPGSAGEQPARYLDAMALLSSEVDRIAAERAKRRNLHAQARGPGGLKVHGGERMRRSRVV